MALTVPLNDVHVKQKQVVDLSCINDSVLADRIRNLIKSETKNRLILTNVNETSINETIKLVVSILNKLINYLFYQQRNQK